MLSLAEFFNSGESSEQDIVATPVNPMRPVKDNQEAEDLGVRTPKRQKLEAQPDLEVWQ